MSKIRNENIYHIKRNFERATGIRLIGSSQAVETPVHSRLKKCRSVALVGLLISLSLLLVAFTWSIFSSKDGDELTLSATYEGNGIVSVQVENRSHKTLEFQPQTKLIKWITDEEVPKLENSVAFKNLSIAPNSTETLTLDLSQAYDTAALESSLATEWYYLLLTNYDFSDGQTWKCSVFFGSQQLDDPDPEHKRYEIEPQILSKIHEELRFYFEDDYYDIFAGNPLHYKYLQKVHEILQRSKKNVVGMVSPRLFLEPIKDGVIMDENSDPDRQYSLRSTWPTVRDEFGKLVGFTEDQHIKKVCVSTEDGWLFPILYLATFEKEEIDTPNSCTFIYGQMISFNDLDAHIVYENERYRMYDVTHLFYTDLRSYFEEIVEMDPKYYKNAEIYWTRIQNVYNYTKENLKFYTDDEWVKLDPITSIEHDSDYRDIWKNGLDGIITSNFDMKKIVLQINAEDESVIYTKSFTPDEPRRHDLSQETEISETIKGLTDGQYTINISVYLSGTEFMSCISVKSCIIYAGAAYEEELPNSTCP